MRNKQNFKKDQNVKTTISDNFEFKFTYGIII